MVLMQLLFDSLSRCFGMPLDPDDHLHQHQHQHQQQQQQQQHYPNHHRQDPNSNTRQIGDGEEIHDDSEGGVKPSRQPLGAQPLGASRSSTRNDQSNDYYFHNANEYSQQYHYHHHPDPEEEEDPDTQHNTTLGNLPQPKRNNLLQRVSSLRYKSPSCCVNPLDTTNDQTTTTTTQNLQEIQKSHFLHSTTNQPQKRNKNIFKKVRKESNKRKLDIFRHANNSTRPSSGTTTTSSSFSSSWQTNLNPFAILCFANPIFDSPSDDLRLHRTTDPKHSNNNNDGEETITSTLYFDAQYEHVKDEQIMTLYEDQSINLLSNEYNNEIVKMYELGEIKHEIQSIHIQKRNMNRHMSFSAPPPPPIRPGSRSMADSDSCCSSTDDVDNDNVSQYRKNNEGFTNHHHDVMSYKTDDGFVPQQNYHNDDEDGLSSPIRSPPSVSRSRQELDVISSWVFTSNDHDHDHDHNTTTNNNDDDDEEEDVVPPSLKLMNNSSLSTQALTPTPSASDAYISPKKVHSHHHEGVYLD